MKWIIVAGGTGGHIMPGLALADELLKRGREVFFVAGLRPIEKRILQGKPFPVFHLDVEGFVGRALHKKLIALVKLARATLRSIKMIKDADPQIVFAEGGYVSIPVVLAGKILGRKLGLHEQNLMPGLANRVLSRLVDRVFVSFPESTAYFPKEKVIFTGNFVRSSLLEAYHRTKSDKDLSNDKKLCLLVLGGSLGARFINELVLKVLPELMTTFENLRIIWQTGLDDYERVLEQVKVSPHLERIKVFSFIDDMGRAYGEADFVICRAGASTIAELCVLGVPALLIPFPFATHNHQEQNARALAEAGCAFMLKQDEANKEQVLSLLREFLSKEELQAKMRSNIKGLGYAQGILRAIEEMESLVGGKKDA